MGGLRLGGVSRGWLRACCALSLVELSLLLLKLFVEQLLGLVRHIWRVSSDLKVILVHAEYALDCAPLSVQVEFRELN